jgi:hypothetical protein
MSEKDNSTDPPGATLTASARAEHVEDSFGLMPRRWDSVHSPAVVKVRSISECYARNDELLRVALTILTWQP